MAPDPEQRRPKPKELVAAGACAEALFRVLKVSYGVAKSFDLDLSSPALEPDVLFSSKGAAALAMRKLQAVRYFATEGVVVASDVILGLLAELHRSLPLLRRGISASAESDLREFDSDLATLQRAATAVIASIYGDGGDDISYFE